MARLVRFHDAREEARLHFSVTAHERKVGMHDADDEYAVREVEREVGIAAQRILVAALGDELHDDSHPHLTHRGGGVRVVETDVVTLHARRVEGGTGLKVKLVQRDVRRQLVAHRVVRVGQCRIVSAPLARGEGIQEATGQPARVRRIQRERGEQRELERRVRLGARVDVVE